MLEVKLKSPSVEELRIPGCSEAMNSGLRPLSSRLSSCDRVISFCTAADSVCKGAAEATTSTTSLVEPTAMAASRDNVKFGSSLLLLLKNFLNPAASTVMLYSPGGRFGTT